MKLIIEINRHAEVFLRSKFLSMFQALSLWREKVGERDRRKTMEFSDPGGGNSPIWDIRGRAAR